MYLKLIDTAIAQASQTAQNNAEKTVNATVGGITDLLNFIINQIPLWLTAAFVLVFTFILARLVKNFVLNKLIEKGYDEENKELEIIAVRGANMIVLIMGTTIALSIIGIDLAPIVAAGAFGIGFAMKDLIMNLIAGMMILGAKHFKIGDIIAVKGKVGKVVEIQTRATIIKAFDGTKIIMPNSELFMNTVVNKWGNPYRKIKIIVRIDFASDLVLAQKCIRKAISKIKLALEKPKPSIKLWNWGASSIQIFIAVWINSANRKYMQVRHELIQNVTEEFRKHGIRFAFPIYTNYNYDSISGIEDLPNLTGGYNAQNAFTDLDEYEMINTEGFKGPSFDGGVAFSSLQNDENMSIENNRLNGLNNQMNSQMNNQGYNQYISGEASFPNQNSESFQGEPILSNGQMTDQTYNQTSSQNIDQTNENLQYDEKRIFSADDKNISINPLAENINQNASLESNDAEVFSLNSDQASFEQNKAS